ncbi:unnamed protein product [Adineta steineri]|uniref:Uncharacterized protein n=1 Tax=Adineta steineri TaxID=433720 RepID=A0A814LTR2_9BILA|nr:unnamed protein product [Adineta steineri]CAF1416069.1 unnamed protein product [Adineta steineri]CAF1437491.1 unnamed protein product [Adineta steineri]
MILHEEDYDKANIILIFGNQCDLQALLDYITYLYTPSNEVLPYSGMSTISIYLLNLFKHPIISWLDIKPHFIINDISEIKTIDQCH